jgi:hypothetical protein
VSEKEKDNGRESGAEVGNGKVGRTRDKGEPNETKEVFTYGQFLSALLKNRFSLHNI